MSKQNQMMGRSEVEEVAAQCVVPTREVKSGGKGQGGNRATPSTTGKS